MTAFCVIVLYCICYFFRFSGENFVTCILAYLNTNKLKNMHA